jgi:hypothetical protein
VGVGTLFDYSAVIELWISAVQDLKSRARIEFPKVIDRAHKESSLWSRKNKVDFYAGVLIVRRIRLPSILRKGEEIQEDLFFYKGRFAGG